MAQGDLPDYDSKLNLPGGSPSVIAPTPIPSFEGATAGADAMSQFGAAVTDLSVKMQEARAHSDLNSATTKYLEGQDAIEQKYAHDPDYKTAPVKFKEELRQLKISTLGGISDPSLRQRAALTFTRAGLSAGRRVDERAFVNEADANTANLDAQELPNLRAAATAASPIERQAAIERQMSSNGQAADAGWISQTARQQRDKRFLGALDASDVTTLIQSDPRRAGDLLDDDKNFPHLTPAQRAQFVSVAKGQTDIDGQLRITNFANYNPAGAAFTAGTLTSPSHARLIFDRGVVPTESGGNNAAVSEKGALGVSQILPGTARDVARQLGLADVAALDDGALKARLLSDEALNYRLGSAYFQQMVTRYAGSVPAALAAYNAGPGRADKWLQQAVEQFGPGFTPAQFAQVVDIKETKDYIGKVAKATGGDMTGAGLSPDGRLRTANAVGARIDGVDTEGIRVAREIARADRITYAPAEILKNGNEPDPATTAKWEQDQIAAAAHGDIEAAKALREYRFRQTMQPVVRQAYASPPAQLDNVIAAEEARQAGRPVLQDEVNRLAALREVRDEVKKRAHAEPVRLLSRAQLAPFVPLDPAAAANDPNFAAALSARGAQGAAAQRLYQGSASPFLSEEATALKGRYANAGPNERFQLIRTMAESLPDASLGDAVVAVTGSQDALVSARIIRERPELGREVMQGAELRKSKEVNERATAVQPAFASKLGGQIYPDPAMQKAVETAAINLYVARAGANQTLYDTPDTSAVEKAIEDITGPIVRRNGVKTPIAPGIEPGRFIGALDHLTQADVNMMGGAVDRNGQPVTPSDISRYAVLKPLAPGSPLYVVGMRDTNARDGFAPLFSAGVADGGSTALIFNMAAIAKGHNQMSAIPGRAARSAADFRAGQAERIRATREQVRAEDAAQ